MSAAAASAMAGLHCMGKLGFLWVPVVPSVGCVVTGFLTPSLPLFISQNTAVIIPGMERNIPSPCYRAWYGQIWALHTDIRVSCFDSICDVTTLSAPQGGLKWIIDKLFVAVVTKALVCALCWCA